MNAPPTYGSILRMASTTERLIAAVETADWPGVAAATLELATQVLELGPDEELAPYLSEESRTLISTLTESVARMKLGPKP